MESAVTSGIVQKKFYPIREVAEAWGVAQCTVYRMIYDGRLPVVKIGRCSRIAAEYVENPPQASR